MKFISTLFGLLVAVSAKVTWRELDTYSFDQYVQHYNRQYSPDELSMRRSLFEKKLDVIREHNKKGLSWKMGVNQFTDRTDKELQSFKGLNKRSTYNKHLEGLHALSTNATRKELPFKVLKKEQLPTSVDWRTKGVVTPVKDQGSCGSCWAFATAEVIESHLALATGHLIELSEQGLVACMPNPDQCGGTGGCKGATTELGFEYVSKNGIASEWVYPYMSHEGDIPACKTTRTSYATVGGYQKLKGNDYNSLMSAVSQAGPITVSVDASVWSTYETGVFDGCNAENPDIDHAVVLVGYGTDSTLGDYWLVRNSWTPSWGEEGYIRIKRRADEDTHCGVDKNPFDGVACKGDPDTVKVCGTCGIIFDSAFPTDVKLA